ncbi:hypothetical protein P8C59_008503 [Phyllachora maydis]|uniref:Uncharacterized protein n=1 Tax=Phyllachora maydis TaxID=1825666 RepID=A0AAD9MIH0_9PEZI|nr:hypothetical protein P8C59_008503 [Phyllachora maydis]
MSQSPMGVISPHRLAMSSAIIPPRSRTQSFSSSDRLSTVTSHALASPPLSIVPEPVFIASSAAAQIVSNDHDGHADSWYDQHGIEPSDEPALVSPAALQLVNKFLDQLLFKFLAGSGSATLTALRPAVAEVLKPKLAIDAIKLADEELREYLGAAADDDAGTDSETDADNGPAGASAPATAPYPGGWDLELVWKRTRLRCMVYSSLGDMEEEDEDFYAERDNLAVHSFLDGHDGDELVSPAVAIFLTSILEFMAEQALIVAGQAASHRVRAKFEKDLKYGTRNPSDLADRIVVEELDMERVALDRTLGRLWRAWKKKIRLPGAGGALDQTISRQQSRSSLRGLKGGATRSPSFNAEPDVTVTEPEPEPEPETMSQARDAAPSTAKVGTRPADETQGTRDHGTTRLAANIPLPLGPKDVDEIEVPGLVSYSDDEEGQAGVTSTSPGRKSKSLLLTPDLVGAAWPKPPAFPSRKRPRSMPMLTTTPSTSSLAVAKAAQMPVGADRDAPPGLAEQSAAAHETRETDDGRANPRLTFGVRDDEAPQVEPGLGSSPTQAGPRPLDVHDADVHVEADEVQIMTSSRISISGRSSSAASDHGRPLALALPLKPSKPMRASSIHSLRLIDVTGPRSPGARSPCPSTPSQGSVMDATEQARSPGGLCFASNVRAPPMVDRRSPDFTLASRSTGLVHHAGKSSRGATESISEAEEVVADHGGHVYAHVPGLHISLAPDLAAGPRPQPVSSHLGRHQASPTALAGGATAGATGFSSTTPSGPFFIESEPDVPKGWRVAARPSPQSSPLAATTPSSAMPCSPLGSATTTPPALPDRSPSRRALASGSVGRPADSSAPATERAHFEELILSDQTIQYTLTPQGMRDLVTPTSPGALAVSGSPGGPAKLRKNSDTRQPSDRSRTASAHRPGDLQGSTSVTPSTGLSSHPVAVAMAPSEADGARLASPSPRSTSLAQATSSARDSQAGHARHPQEPMTDLGDFMRSTGPSGVSYGAAAAPRQESSVDLSRASTTSSGTRTRLQARDASVDYRDNSADLIDFIRRGPPSGVPGNHRIPRTVAPFRTTMDSDQPAGVRSSATSTNVTDYSLQSSTNSQSALLGRNKPLPGLGGRLTGIADDDDKGERPMPKRKTRRVRDPYAIDLSDEEDMDGDMDGDRDGANRRPAAAPKEESLAEFLRNVSPPPPLPPPPPEPEQPAKRATQAGSQPRKKASAPSLMSRLGRRSTERLAESRSLSSRAGGGRGGHIPIQVNVPALPDKYANMDLGSAKAAAMTGISSGAVGGPKPAMKRFEPREAVLTGSRGTSDLADFLRDSAPPSSMLAQGPAPIAPTEAGGFGKVFARRKKSVIG